ncbi:MAG TPA: branched-chain-amino-acid transaminase [Sphingobacteriaceae bacterium]|nr:branched-chain-amino-acid transaminase [Sphingobacteriaceae bacterium]
MDNFNNSTVLYFNGEFIRTEDVKIDAYGQSLHYGFGAFEGIRAYNTRNGVRIFKAEEHYERLKRSCELVNIPYTWDNKELITQTYRLLEINNLKNAYIRPMVLCGPNMALTKPAYVTVMICAWEWSAYLGEKLLRMCTSSYQRPNPLSIKSEAKITGYYVSSILAATEAKEKGYDEALLLDINNNIAEAPAANFFLEKYGCLYTPSLGNILPGITRETIIELCNIFEIEVYEEHLTSNDIKTADSAFLCGTAVEIIGVKSVDDVVFPLDWSDSLGSTLQRAYKNLVLEKENYEIII